MKRIICTVLLLAMCLGMMGTLTACGNKPDNIVRWAIMWYEQKDSAEVIAKANELLAELLPDVKLEIECVEDLSAKMPMWMSSGRRYDLIWSGYAFDVGAEINKKAYKPLNDLIDKHAPNLKAEWAAYESAYNTITVDGQLYGIPHMQYYVAETSRFQIPVELRQYFDEDAFLKACHSSHLATRELFEVIDDYLEKSYNANAWDTDYIAANISSLMDFCTFVAQRGYDFIGTGENGNYMCYDPFAETPVVTNFMLTEQFQLMMEYASKWYKAGYISKDAMSGLASDGRQGIMSAHTVENWFQVDDERGIKLANESGFDVVRYLMDDADNKYQGAVNLGSMASYTCIPVTAKNPELAIQVLDLLHSEKGKELFNLLIYGIEGKHYDKTGENRVDPYDYETQGNSSSDYGVANWMLGNLDYAWETPNILDGQADYVRNYNTNVTKTQHKSPLYGFCVNTEPVTSQLNQITAIFKEYKVSLVNGVMDDYKAYYNTMISKAEAAGLKDAIAEFQSQADAFLNSK